MHLVPSKLVAGSQSDNYFGNTLDTFDTYVTKLVCPKDLPKVYSAVSSPIERNAATTASHDLHPWLSWGRIVP